MKNQDNVSSRVDARTVIRAEKAKEVEAELSDLQDHNRLAIHIWEKSNPFEFPEKTLAEFYEDASEVQEAMQAHPKDPLYLLSMSLLPRASSKLSLNPFFSDEKHTVVGYLVDFTQENEHPARVVRAHEKGLNSGDSPSKKTFYLGRKCRQVPELDALYETVLGRPPVKSGGLIEMPAEEQENRNAIIAAVANDADGTLTNQQLDLLGDAWSDPQKKEAIDYPYNEILVAASHDHIKAIVVPVHTRKNDRCKATAQAYEQFLGGLAGLAHLNRGMDLPVVLYHEDGPQTGQCTYLAQGREELKALVMKSLHTMREHPKDLMRYHGLRHSDDEPFIDKMSMLAQTELETAGLLVSAEPFGRQVERYSPKQISY